MHQASRFDLARALAPCYAHASRREKGQLLDEFCAVTGYTRKHALVVLSCPPPEDRPPPYRGRQPSYAPAEVALLRMCWSATDGICSKRLAPFLPELLERLRHWHALRHVSAKTIERVEHMSPAAINRDLSASRAGLPKRGLSMTRPGTLLKHQVAIKTFADWSETVPGFVEVDLVAHCGWTGAGPFLYTLTLVDVATGWVSCAGLRDKRAQTVLAALRRVHDELPFKILGLDSDNGSEFLNGALLEYCWAQYSSKARLMNSVPLSLSRPRMRNGNSARMRCSAWNTVSWRLSRRPAHATQPVATSTMLSVYRNGPAPLQPQWATRSISKNPGRASVQSANVRMAIWRLSSVPALVVLMPRRALVCSRNGLSARSTVAALKRATRAWTATGNSRNA